MVEHWSEKPGVDSSILSLGILFLPDFPHFVVVQALEYLGATAPLRTVYFALSLLELDKISLKKFAHFAIYKLGIPFRPNFGHFYLTISNN